VTGGVLPADAPVRWPDGGSATGPTVRPNAHVPPWFPPALAVVLALVTAWADFGVRLFKQALPGRPIGMGPDALWMGPIMNLCWFGVPAVALAAAARRWPHRVTPAHVLGVLGFTALADLLLFYRRLHGGAELLLALGLAARLAPVAARHFDVLVRWAPRAVRAAVAAFALATVGLVGGRWGLEWWSLARLAGARDGAPNVIVLVLDTVRAINTSLYGYARPTTPRLAAWAAQGVRFDRAFATAPWTLPSHASMFTGRMPGELSADLRVPLDDTYPTLAEVLRGAGYATGSFVANVSYCTWQYGLTRGFVHTDGYPVTPGMMFASTAVGRRLLLQPAFRRAVGFWDHPGRKQAATVNAAFLDWLGRTRGRPFFAFLNYYDAHFPSLPPAPYDTRFGPRPPPRSPELELVYGTMPAAELTARVAQYDGAIAYMDDQLDRLLRELARRGVLDNTIVVVTSDHGEHWGDHARLSHGNTLYRQLLEVPLVIRYPARVRHGTVVSGPVSLVDLPATVRDLAGVTGGPRLPGTPFGLDPASGAEADHRHAARRPVISENAPKAVAGPLSVISRGFHYIRDVSGREEVYDYARDPGDATDLMRTGLTPEVLAHLRRTSDSVATRSGRVSRP
jgi:arylsulfatase A-like enzyme